MAEATEATESTIGTAGVALAAPAAKDGGAGGGEKAGAAAGAAAPVDSQKVEDGKPQPPDAAAAEAQAKLDAEKKTADEQAAKEAAKALLYSDIKDLTLPEGTFVDEGLAKEFTDVLKENGVSKAMAQKLADMNIKSTGMVLQQLQAEAVKQVEAWNKEVIDDKEIGGVNLEPTKQLAEKMLQVADTIPGVNGQRLRADLVRTGMANHPDMIRLARYFGQHVGDDNVFIPNRSTAGGQQDMASKWYKNSEAAK